MRGIVKVWVSVVVATLLIANVGYAQQKSTCRKIVDEMMVAIGEIKTMRYTLSQSERIDGELGSAKQDVKVAFNPFKLYIYNYAPNDGAEVLYIEGKNNGNALVNPGSFPYINLNLDPYGSILRKGQHHTMFESGFDYLKGIIQSAMDTTGEEFDKYFKLEGTGMQDGRACHKVVITFDAFGYVNYKVKKGQDIMDIAKELNVSEYMIVRKNEDVDWYDDVNEGQVIKVPNAYCKKSVFYIDKINKLPIKSEMFDDKGLFEKYGVSNLKVNTIITDAEFDEDFEDYDF